MCGITLIFVKVMFSVLVQISIWFKTLKINLATEIGMLNLDEIPLAVVSVKSLAVVYPLEMPKTDFFLLKHLFFDKFALNYGS